jgi:PAS domain S-box-containing protein
MIRPELARVRTFRDRPIREKLVLLIMITTIVALALAGVGIVIFDSILFRDGLERDLAALSRIISDNTTAAIMFDDPRAATETLNALRARPHLLSACIYTLNGTMYAKYTRAASRTGCPSPDRTDEVTYDHNDLKVSHGIMQDGERVGTLMILYDLSELGERRRIYGTTVLGVLLVSSLVAFLLSSNLRSLIANPISQLVNATTAVSETNDYSIRARKMSGDELGVLVDRFNEMLAAIQLRDNNLIKAIHEREDALRDVEKARERFRFMAESMPQMIFTATPGGDADYFNRQWTDFTGLSLPQLEHGGWIQLVHPEDREESIRLWRHSLETGEPFSFQHRILRGDGSYRWHLTRVHAMRDAVSGISMWIGSNTDIHEQKEKEEDLRRANDDLQQFAYSASHDLQEPVRNVAVYSELVATRYKDRLDEEGQQFLGFLMEGGRRLAMLISDLLAYTRAGAAERDVSILDSVAVLKHTLSSLAEAIRESDATVTFDPLPDVYMGETHLQQVFQNLISNALKYRADAPPKIHISASNVGATWRFSVQDNGIGIDSQYKERIFGVFKRLHRDQKYSGTGIGLAICQRVVERYGGRIWVESTPGKGSIFFFTVPQYARQAAAASERADG